MTISRALTNAHSGLISSGIRADIASSNIANAQTPGYVRRSVQSEEARIGQHGNGVRSSSIQRDQNFEITRLRRSADGALSQTGHLARAKAELNDALGGIDDPAALYTLMSEFENHLRALSASPESVPYQSAVLSQSHRIVQKFNALGETGRSMRERADSDIATNVEQVNSALHRISKLNQDIALTEHAGPGRAVLEDERQRLIDDISQFMPVRDIYRENGRVELFAESGVVLLSQSVHELKFTPSSYIADGSRYNDGSGQLSGLFIGDQNVTPGSNSGVEISSGSFTALFEIRDSVATGFLDRINNHAVDLSTRLSDPAVDPSLSPGNPGLFMVAGGIGDPLSPGNAAASLQINPNADPQQGGELFRLRDGLGAIAPGPSGQNALIERMRGALAAGGAPAAGGLLENIADYSSEIGSAAFFSDAIHLGAQSRQSALAEAELSSSGVDTDFELQSLIVIEQAYAANARVMQVVSDMLDRLMEL